MDDRFNNIEELGINAAHRIITQDFGWIFREKTKRDIGFDAEAETKLDGFIIQIQIKTGLGNFKILKNNHNGLTYYVDKYHYDYWLKIKHPVIFLAHIPQDEKTYWQIVTNEKLVKANKRWKLFIPFKQELNIDSKDKILDLIAKPTEPKVYFTPKNECTAVAKVRTDIIDLGRIKQVSITKSKNGVIINDKTINSIINSVTQKARLFQDISDLKQKIYKNTSDYNLRLALATKYIKLDDYNNSTIELSGLKEELLKKLREGKSSSADRISLVLTKYFYHVVVEDMSNFFGRLAKIRIVIFVRIHLYGRHTKLIEPTLKVNLNNNEIELKKYNPEIYIIPVNMSLENTYSLSVDKIKYTFNINSQDYAFKPTLSRINFNVEIGLMENGVLLNDYCIDLIT